MQIAKFAEGHYSLYLLVLEGVAPVKEYLNGLREKEEKQFFNLFERILHHGPPKNEEKFRHIGDEIYELKVGSGHRILCFFAGSALPRALILTHGFRKPGKRVLQREKQKALGWKTLNNIEIVNL